MLIEHAVSAPPGPAAPGWSHRSRRRALLLALAVVALPACGKRGDPLPPLERTPQPVSAMRLAQRGSTLEVTLTAPRATTGGARLDVMEIVVLQSEKPGDLEKIATPVVHRSAPGETVTLSLPLAPPGSTVRLATRVRAGGRDSPLTRSTTLGVQPIPAAPTALTARPSPTGVSLGWEGTIPVFVKPEPAPLPSPSPGAPPVPSPAPAASPAAPVPGGSPAPPVASPAPAIPEPVGGFLVYRRARDEEGPGTAVNRAPLPGTAFEDTSATIGMSVCYVVRAAVSMEPLIESASSNDVCVEVKDVAPPLAPTGLVALPREGGIEISWSPSTEEDVAAYRVYRGIGDAGRVRVIEGSATSWTDPAAPAEKLSYSVTAVDKAGNESAHSRPVRVEGR